MTRNLSSDHWRAAVKYLMGQGTNPELSARDQRILRECLRGPFIDGMTETQAVHLLTGMGWRKRP